uniref:Uncharacterized protein n=1 Tax=Oryza glumipatula TaxID=40148 RepID=A0A0D9Z9G0_9ORYZ
MGGPPFTCFTTQVKGNKLRIFDPIIFSEFWVGPTEPPPPPFPVGVCTAHSATAVHSATAAHGMRAAAANLRRRRRRAVFALLRRPTLPKSPRRSRRRFLLFHSTGAVFPFAFSSETAINHRPSSPINSRRAHPISSTSELKLFFSLSSPCRPSADLPRRSIARPSPRANTFASTRQIHSLTFPFLSPSEISHHRYFPNRPGQAFGHRRSGHLPFPLG